MKSQMPLESYPFSIVLISNLVTLSIYGLGFYIIFHLNFYFALFYLLYILILELRLIKNHCTKCYYWGKTCGFGKGRISATFFKKGDSARFCNVKMTWADLIPDMLISIVPLIVGIILIILHFSFLILGAMLILLIMTTTGNGFVRGKLVCLHCKQKEIGCPAELLFKKEK